MKKINVLDSKIFNRIAAGEVIERPSSVVKEIVENSIDACARNISISIFNGGKSLIKIIDDGIGIEKTELNKSILPHATSKISSVEDLESISTLGFRGEALPSIASVSKLSITSKTKEQNFGASICVEGGIVSPVNDSPCENGTEICVENLFCNAPVRARFLKTDKSEEGEISATVARFILGYPNISFNYFSENKKVLQSFGDGFESAFINIYGVDTLKNCFYIETEKNGIKIEGYVSKHNFFKSNRSNQIVFLNGRYVLNSTISSSIQNAYSPYLMTRQYPFYVLKITMPEDGVDVNVHPNKIDVRFINNSVVYGTIYSIIRNVLDGSKETLDIVKKDYSFDDKKTEKNTTEIDCNYVRHKPLFTLENFKLNDSNSERISQSDKQIIKESEKEKIDIFAENKAYIEKLEKERQEKLNTISFQKIDLDKKLNVIGQALNSFLVLDDGVDLFLIDQHAAHERLLFDKLNKSIIENEIPVQPLLVPYTFVVSGDESAFLNSKIDVFNSMGIEIDEFGLNTFKISSIPSIISDMDLNNFILDILKDLNDLRSISTVDILKDKIAQKACKSAIKAGDKLSQNEIDSLLKMINGDFSIKCPHGRPICVKISRNEIDKWFKRIV